MDRKSARAPKKNGRESAVGAHKHKRTPTDIGLALITPIVGQEFLDRYNLRDPLNRGLSTASSRSSRSPARPTVSSSGCPGPEQARPG